MIDLLQNRGLGDVIGKGYQFRAGSTLTWNGWLPTPWVSSIPSASAIEAILRGPGFLDDVRAVVTSTLGLAPYLKVAGTLGFDSNLSSFQNFVEENLAAAGYTLTRQGIGVDYAAPGSEGKQGDMTAPENTGGTGGGSCFSSGDFFNCLGAQIGVSGGILIGAGALILILVLFGAKRR